MKPEKFKEICKRYFVDSTFTMEDISNVDGKLITISIFFCGYGVLRYCCSDDDKEKPFLLIADKFIYIVKNMVRFYLAEMMGLLLIFGMTTQNYIM